MAACPSCGFDNRGDAKFCSECGTALAAASPGPREERKVVSVLFCDLVGFTQRAEQLDPEEVRAIQQPYFARLRQEIERFGGTVEKFIGDAVMALFGAPVTHEDDPERAVRAALAIRDWIVEEHEDLQVRIAVNTGEALINLGARPEAGEGMASGDVVNTTARLQAAAPANGILVGETTYRATRDAIDYRAAAAVEAKGKAQPIAVWEALHARARVQVERMGRAPLIGREKELALVRDALARAREEREPQLVTIVGVPGIGKSRLVFELFKLLEQGPELVYWRHGRSLPYGEGVSFWALGEMVKAQAGILESDGADAAEAKLAQAIGGLFAEEDDARWVLAHLRPLVGIEADGEMQGDRREEAFAAWRRFFESLGEQRPLIVVFEDLHWADEGLLDFVDYLSDWTSGVPLLILCTARPELLSRRPGWGGGKPNALTISLSPLSDEETARLVHEVLKRPVLDVDAQAALVAGAGGNPLYAEEFARLVEERGFERDGEAPLPETVQGIIAARVDALDGAQKELLHDAAVLGRTFWPAAAAFIGSRDERVVERLLHGLERREFVRRERRSSVAGELEYTFKHVLVRDVAYAQIPRAHRARKHELAARWIESVAPDRAEDRAEMLAHHYLSALELARAAGGPTDAIAARARAALRDAGDRALALNAFESAGRFYSAALELWPADHPERSQILYRFGKAESIAHERGEELLAEALNSLDRAGERETAAEAAVALADLIWRRGDRGRAMAYLDRAAALVDDAPPSPAKASVLSNLSRFRMIGGENDAALRTGLEALAMAEGLGLEELQAHALNNVGSARMRIGDSDGEADLGRSIEVALRLNSPEAARAYNNLAVMAAEAGDLRRTFEIWEEGRRVCASFGPSGMLRFLELQRIPHAYAIGDWDEALRMAEELIAEAEAGSPHYFARHAAEVRAYIDLARGNAADAIAAADVNVELGRATMEPQSVYPALGFAAFAHATAGSLERARSYADELLALPLQPIPNQTSPEFGLAWTLVASDAGDVLLERAARVERRWRWLDAAVAICSGELARAADLYDEIGALPNEAYTRLRAAQAGDPDAQLDKAMAFFRRVGASAYLREAEAVVAATA